MKKLTFFVFVVCGVLIFLIYAKKINVPNKTDKRTAAKATEVTVSNKDKVEKVRIEIDPGHGGVDTGAQITADGTVTYEKTLNLKLSLYLKTELEKYQGVTVSMTRKTDKNISLKKRVEKAKKDQADALISIHHNAKGSIVNAKDGVYVLVASGNEKENLAQEEEQLGANILNRISELGLKNRGLLRRLSETRNTYRNGRYMDNIDEFQSYFSSDEKIQEMAEKDAQGIADYFHLLKDSHKAARATIKKNIKITTVKDPKGKDNTYQTRSYQLSVNQ